MKRIISLILILISLALPLSACSDAKSAIYSVAEDIFRTADLTAVLRTAKSQFIKKTSIKKGRTNVRPLNLML